MHRVTVYSALVFFSIVPAFAQPTPQPADLMRAGVGIWCYDPVGTLTDTIRAEYVDLAVARSADAQSRYGVPGALLAAMSIRESGYGRTRLAILSNNVLSFKRPRNTAWQFGRPTFVLWCQPAEDIGNEYLHFGSKDAAFDYVAKVLAEREDLPYRRATEAYKAKLVSNTDRRAAAVEWLRAVAASYAQDPAYVNAVLDLAEAPLGRRAETSAAPSLWERIPP